VEAAAAAAAAAGSAQVFGNSQRKCVSARLRVALLLVLLLHLCAEVFCESQQALLLHSCVKLLGNAWQAES